MTDVEHKTAWIEAEYVVAGMVRQGIGQAGIERRRSVQPGGGNGVYFE